MKTFIIIVIVKQVNSRWYNEFENWKFKDFIKLSKYSVEPVILLQYYGSFVLQDILYIV